MIDLLRKRRSIRRYKSRKIEPKTLKLLQEALLRSPSSRDIKPWYFIFVDDCSLLQRLSRCKEHGSQFLAGAPFGIVVCADETKSDVWVEDCSIAAILVQMAAQSCGLGSCWIQVRNRFSEGNKSSESIVQKLLSIPKHIRVESIIALGYPAEKKKRISANKLPPEKIRFNKF
jgi:nitroreductase